MPSGSPPFSLSIPEPDVHVAGDPLGRTYTPDLAALAILKRLAEKPCAGRGGAPRLAGAESFLDPCLGGGAWARAFRAVVPPVAVFSGGSPGPFVAGSDLDPDAPGRRDVDAFEVRDATEPVPPALVGRFSLAATNPPFGLEVGQEVTTAIVASLRRLGIVSVALVPVDYLTQAGWEDQIAECVEVWPLLPRPFGPERGMVALVWDARNPTPALTAYQPLRWRSGR